MAESDRDVPSAKRPDNSIDETALMKLAGDWGVKVGNDIVVTRLVRLFEVPAPG